MNTHTHTHIYHSYFLVVAGVDFVTRGDGSTRSESSGSLALTGILMSGCFTSIGLLGGAVTVGLEYMQV